MRNLHQNSSINDIFAALSEVGNSVNSDARRARRGVIKEKRNLKYNIEIMRQIDIYARGS